MIKKTNPPKNKIQFVYFDIGKVLIDYDFDIMYDWLIEFSPLSRSDVINIYHKIFNLLAEGKINAEKALENLRKELKIEKRNLTYKKYKQQTEKMFFPKREARKTLLKINQKIKKGIISDIEPFAHNIVKKENFLDLFPPRFRVFSYKVKSRKPGPKIYTEAIKRTGLKPEEVLYIDNIKEFCNAFEKLGGNSIHFDLDKEDFNDLERELEAAGLM